MKLLAFETATEACSVALWIEGQVLERFELAPRRHAEVALPWADELLARAGIARAQLDAIAVGRGPGAFTGVRLAIALAQGVALALDRPVLPVSTLTALAMQGGEGNVLAAIDARMGEVYYACYRRHGDALTPLADEALAPPGQVAVQAGPWQGVGTGFEAVQGTLAQRLGTQLLSTDARALPHAADVAHLAAQAYARGEAMAPERIEPAYLRNNVALTIVEQQALRDARR